MVISRDLDLVTLERRRDEDVSDPSVALRHGEGSDDDLVLLSNRGVVVSTSDKDLRIAFGSSGIGGSGFISCSPLCVCGGLGLKLEM